MLAAACPPQFLPTFLVRLPGTTGASEQPLSSAPRSLAAPARPSAPRRLLFLLTLLTLSRLRPGLASERSLGPNPAPRAHPRASDVWRSWCQAVESTLGWEEALCPPRPALFPLLPTPGVLCAPGKVLDTLKDARAIRSFLPRGTVDLGHPCKWHSPHLRRFWASGVFSGSSC